MTKIMYVCRKGLMTYKTASYKEAQECKSKGWHVSVNYVSGPDLAGEPIDKIILEG